MSRRTILQQLLAAIAIVIVLFVGGPALAQGNRDAAFERVREVQERHTDALMARPGVVGTAVGLDDGNPAVVVLLEHGAVGNLPAVLEGVKVKKVVTGQIVARADATTYARPVPIGVSTGNAGECSAGTIGCRVTDGTNVYALSNNHVYALENSAPIGSNVVQPGLYDTSCAFNEANVIGNLYDFEPIARRGNVIDAAIALCEPDTLGYSTPDGGYTPSSTTVPATLGLAVKKRGRTTELTTGTVAYVNVTVSVLYYNLGIRRFVGQIGITPGSFSDSGDSGSLIVTESGNHPVGLLFAGGDTATFANPIDAVLDRFNVTIDDGSGSPPPDDTTPPQAPTDLTATPGDGRVSLDWADNSEPDLASYTVYRSTSSGSGYGSVASGVAASEYVDSDVVNGETYFYVVTAIDTSGNESLSSAEASATPTGGTSGGEYMYVWGIAFAETGPHLKVIVTIRADSDGDGIDEASDDPLSDATVTLELTHESDPAETYTGTTDSSGSVQFQWKKAPSGAYTAQVTDLTRSGYTWDEDMSVTSVDYTK